MLFQKLQRMTLKQGSFGAFCFVFSSLAKICICSVFCRSAQLVIDDKLYANLEPPPGIFQLAAEFQMTDKEAFFSGLGYL